MEDNKIIEANHNETKIKILISEVNMIFAYWSISEEYNQRFIKKYGDEFFDKTKEVIIVKNLSNGKQKRIEIEQPTNNYYIKIGYANSIYQVELVRVGKQNKEEYGYKIISNKIKSPNIKVLFNTYDEKNIEFKNIKNGTKINKSQDYKKGEMTRTRIEELYEKLIIHSWNEYKAENGYKEK